MNYEFIEFQITKQIEDQIVELSTKIFDNLDIEKFKWNLAHKNNLTFSLAYSENKLIAFKIGYSKDKNCYYSWLGGVDEMWRKRGVARELMIKQHDWCRSKGFKFVETQTLNRWREMLICNLKNGFEVVGVCQSNNYGLKIILKKSLQIC